jgi:hypothetical protein
MNLFSPIVDVVQDTARQTERLVRGIYGGAAGIVREARGGRRAPKPDMDDVTLARKVETEIFRPRGAPKGSVDVNVVEGVVYLRGEVKRPEQIKTLEARVREIPEVRGVENLLHLPKTPSPTRADTPRRVQKNPPSPKPAPRRRSTAVKTRVTAEAPAEAVGTGRRGPATAPETGKETQTPSRSARPATPGAPTTTESGFTPAATAGEGSPDPGAGAGGSTELKPDA